MIKHNGTQIIRSQRLLLRKITSDDIEMIFSWMSDPEVTKFEDWIPHESIDYTCGFITWLTNDYKTEQTYCWGIQLGEEIIGIAMVVGVNEWNGSIAYYIKRALWSNGYATEAVDAILDYMFFEVGVDRITAKHSVMNPASGRVLKKVGMRYMGHVMDYEYYASKSQWHDFDFYSITKEQYLQRDLSAQHLLLDSHCVFPTPDIKRTAAYYVNVMGFRAVEYLDVKEPHICLYRDNTEIILTQANSEKVYPNRELYGYGEDAYFITDEQEALQRELREKGANIVSELRLTDYNNREFTVEDIDGRWIVFGIKEG